MADDKKGEGRIDVMLLGGKPDAESMDSSNMALDAAWKAIKGDDKAGFKAAMRDYVEYCMDDMGEGKEKEEPKPKESSGDDEDKY